MPEVKRRCPRCGKENEPGTINLGSRKVSIDRYCDECKLKNELEFVRRWRTELKASREQSKKLRGFELWEQANLGPRFARSTFNTWEQLTGTERAFKAVRRFVDEWPHDEGLGLLLVGPVGCGKSHLAAAAIQELLNRGVFCIFQSVPELLRRLRSSFGAEASSSDEMMKALEECELLVLDDLGSERWTAWAEEQIYTLIDYRYRHEMPTVVTTNMTLKQLEKSLGTRIMDRLVDMCLPVSLESTGYRRRRAELRKLGLGDGACASST